jgi:hypothetical protein
VKKAGTTTSQSSLPCCPRIQSISASLVVQALPCMMPLSWVGGFTHEFVTTLNEKDINMLNVMVGVHIDSSTEASDIFSCNRKVLNDNKRPSLVCASSIRSDACDESIRCFHSSLQVLSHASQDLAGIMVERPFKVFLLCLECQEVCCQRYCHHPEKETSKDK